MGRTVQSFLAMVPPTTTHNDLSPFVRRDGSVGLRKSDRLKDAEALIRAHLSRVRPEVPLVGPLRADVRWCFPTGGGHAQGEPMTARPDLDNLEKTFLDCCEREGLIADDRLVVEKRTAKAWSDPPGIFFRFEELRGAPCGEEAL